MKNIYWQILIFFFVFSATSYGQNEDRMIKIGESATNCYVMYTDNDGNLYYVNIEDHQLDLLKYSVETGETKVISEDFIDDHYDKQPYNNGFGAIAPTPSGDTVYCMTTAGTNHGNAEIFRLICSQDKLEYLTDICGKNYWKIFNMTLTRDNKSLLYVANNVGSGKALYKIDLETLLCESVLELDKIIPNRDLCFGGINVWDQQNNFYVPVWSFNYDINDCVLMKIHVENNEYSAKLIHFTDNTKASGTALSPKFRHHSCWSGIGASSKGNIYIAVSNHHQPKSFTGTHGNAAIYKYSPVDNKVTLIGDLQSASESVDNWIEEESQHKIHTFLIENADGKMYFASGDYNPSYYLRGSHLYTIDIENDVVEDFSKKQSLVMRKDFSVVENTDKASDISGIFIEYFGIKSISLNKNVPNLIYAQTFSNNNGVKDPGYIIKYEMTEGGNIATAISSPTRDYDINVYPNPFVDKVVFDFNKNEGVGAVRLQVFDNQGRLVLNEPYINDNTYLLNMNNNSNIKLNSGFYIYSITMEGKAYAGKLIKK